MPHKLLLCKFKSTELKSFYETPEQKKKIKKKEEERKRREREGKGKEGQGEGGRGKGEEGRGKGEEGRALLINGCPRQYLEQSPWE